MQCDDNGENRETCTNYTVFGVCWLGILGQPSSGGSSVNTFRGYYLLISNLITRLDQVFDNKAKTELTH